jgi:hypothetical protein
VTGRRVQQPYDPVGAQTFRAITVTFFVLGLAFVALAAGWLLVDWRISGRVVLAGLGGLVSGVMCTVAAAFWMHAVDGPPGAGDDDDLSYLDDDDEDDDLPSIDEAGRAQAECPTCESTSRSVRLIDEGDGLPCGDPIGWHDPRYAWVGGECDDEVADDVREDAERHADEDYPYGLPPAPGGAQ